MNAMIDTHQQYAQDILDALGRIAKQIEVPEGHAIKFNPDNEMSWLMSVPSGSASLYIQRASPNIDDANQFHAEVRIHNNRRGVHTKYAATLFLQQGSPFVGQQHSLLWYQEPFVYAEGLGELEEKIITRIATGLARAEPSNSHGARP